MLTKAELKAVKRARRARLSKEACICIACRLGDGLAVIAAESVAILLGDVTFASGWSVNQFADTLARSNRILDMLIEAEEQ